MLSDCYLTQVRQPATVRTGCYDVIVNGITIFIAMSVLSAPPGSCPRLDWCHYWLNNKVQVRCHCRNIFKDTPLHYASEAGHLEVVRYFINEQHCDPMTKDYRHHFTMLVNMVTCIAQYLQWTTLWPYDLDPGLHFTMLVNMVTSTLPSTSLILWPNTKDLWTTHTHMLGWDDSIRLVG